MKFSFVCVLAPVLMLFVSNASAGGESENNKQRAVGVRLADSGGGWIIDNVWADSPAEKAGLKPGDLVVSLNSMALPAVNLPSVKEKAASCVEETESDIAKRFSALTDMVEDALQARTVTIQIERDGKGLDLRVSPADFEAIPMGGGCCRFCGCGCTGISTGFLPCRSFCSSCSVI